MSNYTLDDALHDLDNLCGNYTDNERKGRLADHLRDLHIQLKTTCDLNAIILADNRRLTESQINRL